MVDTNKTVNRQTANPGNGNKPALTSDEREYLGILVEYFTPKIPVYLRNRGAAPENIDELVSDCYEEICKSARIICRLDPRTWHNYFYRLCTNVFLKKLRDKNRKSSSPQLLEKYRIHVLQVVMNNPARVVWTREFFDLFTDIIQELTPLQLERFTYYLLNGCDYPYYIKENKKLMRCWISTISEVRKKIINSYQDDYWYLSSAS